MTSGKTAVAASKQQRERERGGSRFARLNDAPLSVRYHFISVSPRDAREGRVPLFRICSGGQGD